MRILKKALVCVAFILLCSIGCFGEIEDNYFVPNEENPEKAKKIFFEAMKQWLGGKRPEALELYEKAFIADRSVLSENDMGMARALVESYRERVATPGSSNAMLWRLGFFEETISGNLQLAKQNYEKVYFSTEDPQVKAIAKIEVEKLSRELSYIMDTQAENLRKKFVGRAKEIRSDKERDRRKEIDEQISEIEDEKESLRERIAELQNQEKELRDQQSTNRVRMNRYRRSYYDYNGFNNGNSSVTDVSPGSPSSLELFYANRRRVNERKTEIAKVQAEVSEIYKELNSLDVKIARLQEMKK